MQNESILEKGGQKISNSSSNNREICAAAVQEQAERESELAERPDEESHSSSNCSSVDNENRRNLYADHLQSEGEKARLRSQAPEHLVEATVETTAESESISVKPDTLAVAPPQPPQESAAEDNKVMLVLRAVGAAPALKKSRFRLGAE
jgi:hypothetical protein